MKAAQLKDLLVDYKLPLFLLFIGLGWLGFWLLVIFYSLVVL